MGSSLLGTIFMVFAGFVFVAGLLIAGVVVAVVAFRLYQKRTQIQTINVADGIDEAEMKIIREIFAKQKSSEDQAAVKERMAKAAL